MYVFREGVIFPIVQSPNMRLIQTHVKSLAIANQNSHNIQFAKTSTKATFKQIIELRVMVCVIKYKITRVIVYYIFVHRE